MTDELNKEETWRYAEKAMSWYGWGSPTGLGAFVLTIAAAIYLLHLAGLY